MQTIFAGPPSAGKKCWRKTFDFPRFPERKTHFSSDFVCLQEATRSRFRLFRFKFLNHFKDYLKCLLSQWYPQPNNAGVKKFR